MTKIEAFTTDHLTQDLTRTTLSGGSDGYSCKIGVKIRGADSKQLAYRFALNESPTQLTGDQIACRPPLWRTLIEITELDCDKGIWCATLHYKSVCSPQDEVLTWGTGGGTELVTTSIATSTAFDLENCQAIPPIFGGNINVTHDGQVEGCEIPVAQPKFSITKCYAPGSASTCANLWEAAQFTGCTNDAIWKNCFPAESVLFEGIEANGVLLGSIYCQQFPESQFGADIVTFNFRVSAPVTIPMRCWDGTIVNIQKPGWHKFWAYNEKTTLNDPMRNIHLEVTRPKFIFVEQVLPKCDFSNLAT
jgi:hypothetical protein